MKLERNGSGSGSSCHQATLERKHVIFSVLCLLYGFLSVNNDVIVGSKNNKKKNLEKHFLLPRSLTKRAGSGVGSVSQRYGSEDPDPYQNVTDPEHRFLLTTSLMKTRDFLAYVCMF